MAFQDIRDGSLSKSSVDTATAYAAAVTLYGNGQRSGAITNLTIAEFEMREEGDNELVVIPCVHHKTGAQGLAQLVITQDIEDVLVYYHQNIRQKIVPAEDSCQNNFFLCFNGSLYTQVYRRITEALAIGTFRPPPPSHYRVLISTDAKRNLDDSSRRNVVKHLSHSMKTSEIFYEFLSSSDATEAHRSILNLSNSRRWSQDEIKQLTSRWPLTGKSPSFRDCRQLIEEGLNRTVKQIIYKWNFLAQL